MTGMFGARVKRREDPRLLTGQAQFVDDVHLPNTVQVAFKRSDYAHARLLSVDVEAAREMPGVIAVYKASDLGDYWQPSPLLVPPPPTQHIVFNQRTAGPLAPRDLRRLSEHLLLSMLSQAPRSRIERAGLRQSQPRTTTVGSGQELGTPRALGYI